MNLNGEAQHETHGQALTWSRRVLCAADLRKSLNGHCEVVLAPETIVTPLAGEELRLRGIALRRVSPTKSEQKSARFGYGQDRSYPLVASAVQALAREGLVFREFAPLRDDLPCRWAKGVAECLTKQECWGGVLFCEDPGLVSCVANKVAGLRAVSVTTVSQAARATLSMAANLLVVEMPGRTFFEIRQILRTLSAGRASCPEGVAHTLKELDGHAHR